MKSLSIRNMVLGFLFFTLTISCNNPTAITPGSQGEIITTGIEFTSMLFPLGWGESWGNPISVSKLDIGSDDDSNGSNHTSPNYFEFDLPYPNPFNGEVIFSFSIPKKLKLKAWLETAYLPGSSNLPLGNNYQQNYLKTVLFERDYDPGYFSVRYNMPSTCNEGEIEQGFYRIFLMADNEHLLFHDIYITGDSRLAPSGLDDNSVYHPCNSDIND